MRELISIIEAMAGPASMDGWWITNTGEVLQCDHHYNVHHADLASEFFHTVTPGGLIVSHDPENQALAAGWVRGSWFDHSITVEWKKSLSTKTRHKLIGWVQKYGPSFTEFYIEGPSKKTKLRDFAKALLFLREQTSPARELVAEDDWDGNDEEGWFWNVRTRRSITTGSQTHTQMALSNPQRFGLDLDNEDLSKFNHEEDREIIRRVVSNGWVRCFTMRGILYMFAASGDAAKSCAQFYSRDFNEMRIETIDHDDYRLENPEEIRLYLRSSSREQFRNNLGRLRTGAPVLTESYKSMQWLWHAPNETIMCEDQDGYRLTHTQTILKNWQEMGIPSVQFPDIDDDYDTRVINAAQDQHWVRCYSSPEFGGGTITIHAGYFEDAKACLRAYARDYEKAQVEIRGLRVFHIDRPREMRAFYTASSPDEARAAILKAVQSGMVMTEDYEHGAWYWNARTKEIVPCFDGGSMHHTEFALAYPEKLGIDPVEYPKNHKKFYDEGVLAVVAKHGWVRCYRHRGELNIYAYDLAQAQACARFYQREYTQMNIELVDGQMLDLAEPTLIRQFATRGKVPAYA